MRRTCLATETADIQGDQGIAREDPNDMRELQVLGQKLSRRRAGILAYFDTVASNGPVDNINGKVEHLSGTTLKFRNKANYVLMPLIQSSGLREETNALLILKVRLVPHIKSLDGPYLSGYNPIPQERYITIRYRRNILRVVAKL